MITINSLAKRLSKSYIMTIKHLSIRDGEILAIIGNNGSGKSILLNAILSNIVLDSGSISIGGYDNRESEWKRNTGAYMSTNYLLDFMTPKEYFCFVGQLYGMSSQAVKSEVEKYHIFLGREFREIERKPISKLSKGAKDKIGIIAAFLPSPNLIVLDEPFAHIDNPSLSFLLDHLQKLNRERNTTIVVTSPTHNELIRICSRFLFLDNGQIVMDLENSSDAVAKLNTYISTTIIH